MSIKDQAKDKSNYAVIIAICTALTAYWNSREIKADTATTDENISEAISLAYDDLAYDNDRLFDRVEDLEDEVLILRFDCDTIDSGEGSPPPLERSRPAPKKKSFKEQYKIDIPTQTWK